MEEEGQGDVVDLGWFLFFWISFAGFLFFRIPLSSARCGLFSFSLTYRVVYRLQI